MRQLGQKVNISATNLRCGTLQRSFVFVLGWGLILGLVALGVYWWIGPSLTNLAFFDDNRSEPYTVVEFYRSDNPNEVVAAYGGPLRELVLSESGQVFPDYELQHVSRGVVADEWSAILAYQLPQASQTVEVMTSGAYKLLPEIGPDTQVLRLGTYATTTTEQWQQSLVVLAARLRESRSIDPLVNLTALVDQADILIDEHPDNIDNDMTIDRLIVLSFDGYDQARDWLNSQDVDLELAIVSSKVQHLSVGIYTQQAGS